MVTVRKRVTHRRKGDFERQPTGERAAAAVLVPRLERLGDAPVPLGAVLVPVLVRVELWLSPEDVGHELPVTRTLRIVRLDGFRDRLLVVARQFECLGGDLLQVQPENELVSRKHVFPVPVVDEVHVLAVDRHGRDEVDRGLHGLPPVVLVLAALVLRARTDAVRHEALLDEHAHRPEDVQVVEGVGFLLFAASPERVRKSGVLDKIVTNGAPICMHRRLETQQDVVYDFDARKGARRRLGPELLLAGEPSPLAAEQEEGNVALVDGVRDAVVPLVNVEVRQPDLRDDVRVAVRDLLVVAVRARAGALAKGVRRDVPEQRRRAVDDAVDAPVGARRRSTAAGRCSSGRPGT